MCQCPCDSFAQRLKFPGPNGGTYVLSLYAGCTNCHVGSAIRIESYKKGSKYKSDIEEFGSGDLVFETSDGRTPNDGEVVIITGMNQDDFRKTLASHLIGIGIRDGMFNDDNTIDEYGADEILSEMYQDAQVAPHIMHKEHND